MRRRDRILPQGEASFVGKGASDAASEPSRERRHPGRHAPGGAGRRPTLDLGRHDEHARRGRATCCAVPTSSDIGACRRRAARPRAALKGEPELANEAVKYLAIMALVDGTLDHSKLARVLDYSRALDVEADYLTDLVEAASGHLAWATADMWRKNFDSVHQPIVGRLDPDKPGSRPMAGPKPSRRWWRATTRSASCRKTPSARRCGISTRGTAIRSPAIRRRSTPLSARRTIRRT